MTSAAAINDILETTEALRWEVGQDFHEQLMEDIYAEAAQLADRSVTCARRSAALRSRPHH